MIFSIEGNVIAEYPIVTTEGVEKMTFFDIFMRLVRASVTVR